MGMFTRDRRAALKAAQPDLKTTELAKAMSAEWKALSADAKDKYTAEAASAKSEYATKLAEYKKTSEFGKFTLKLTEIAKLMGAEWKTLSEAEKKPFVAEAEKAKSAYTAAMATYKGSADFAAHSEAVAQWKRSEKLGKAEADANAPKVSLPRKPKDANKPKAAQTAYFAFTASRRAAISAENPE